MRSAVELEERFHDERFQKRKRSSNWDLYLLYMMSVVPLAVFSGYALFKKAIYTVLMVPPTAFDMPSLSYVLNAQMRRSTELSPPTARWTRCTRSTCFSLYCRLVYLPARRTRTASWT